MDEGSRPCGAHLPGSPSPDASVWPFRARARRPSECEAPPLQGGGRREAGRPALAAGPSLRCSGEPAEVAAAGYVRGRGGRVSPGLRPAWFEPGPAPGPPRGGRETEAGAGRQPSQWTSPGPGPPRSAGPGSKCSRRAGLGWSVARRGKERARVCIAHAAAGPGGGRCRHAWAGPIPAV